MKLFKKMRKGFTLIELVVVIAVIAILSAVSIVSYVAITNRAKQSNDEQKINQVNLSLAAAEVSAKPQTMYDAMKAVGADGFGPDRFKAESKEYTFAYKMSKNRFVILQKDKVVYPKDIETGDKADLWVFSDKGGDLKDGYSHYLRGEINEEVQVNAGLDVGENKNVPAVSYSSDKGQKVIIRTNSELTTLNVNAPTDTVYHYGLAGLVDIISIDSNASYHEHGEISLAKIANGRIVITQDATIGGIHAVETNDSFNDIKVAVVGNAEVPAITRDAVSEDSKTEEGTYNKFVLEIQTIASENTTEDNSEYVWISVVVDGSGTTVNTEVANSNTTLNEQTKIAESSQSSAAKAIAETTTEATTAEAAENALVSTLIKTMAELKEYITGEVVNGVIGSDIEVNEIMELGGDKVLNLNGYTLNINLSSGRPFVFSNGQSMTVNANEGGMKIINYGAYGLFRIQSPFAELILNGGTYEGYVDDAAALIRVLNSGGNLTYSVNVELNDLNVNCIGQAILDDACAGHPYYDSYREAGVLANKVTVKGGHYSFNNAGYDVNGSVSGFVLQYDDVLFDGVEILSAIGSVMELDGGTALFRNNNFIEQNINNIQGWNATTIGIAYEANVTIESGNYTGYYGLSIFSSGGNLIINGGTVVGTSGNALDLYANTSQDSFGHTSTCVINGGNITGEISLHGTVEVTDNR